MAEEQDVIKITINQEGVFKVKDYYSFLKDIIKSLGFDYIEDVFSKKDNDIVFVWTCLQWIDDYVQYKIWMEHKLLGVKNVKVKREELTDVIDKAKVSVTIKGTIITDYDNRWESNPVIKFFKSVYDTVLFKSEINDRKKKLIDTIYLIENELKSFLELPRFM